MPKCQFKKKDPGSFFLIPPPPLEGEANSIAIIRPCPHMLRMCCLIDGLAFRAFNAFKSSLDLKNREWLRICNWFERVSECTMC